jgi:hypothetical protein
MLAALSFRRRASAQPRSPSSDMETLRLRQLDDVEDAGADHRGAHAG